MITVQKRKFVERLGTSSVYGRSVRITLHFHLCNVFIVIFFQPESLLSSSHSITVGIHISNDINC